MKLRNYILAGIIGASVLVNDYTNKEISVIEIPKRSIEEIVLSDALTLRAREIEKKINIKFSSRVDVRIENLSYRNNSPAGMYEVETRTILLPVSTWYGLNVELDMPLRLACAEDVSNVKEFQGTFDHELGHKIADDVSRRNGLGPWFTKEYKETLKQPESLGLNVLTEGFARWVQYTLHPTSSKFSEEMFPESIDDARFYTYDMVTYDGGYWIVKDILDKHGEKGLVWLIKNPLSINYEHMRSDAVEYKTRALNELNKK